MEADGVIAAAGGVGDGKIAKEGQLPSFFMGDDRSQFPKVAQDLPCRFKSVPSIISW